MSSPCGHKSTLNRTLYCTGTDIMVSHKKTIIIESPGSIFSLDFHTINQKTKAYIDFDLNYVEIILCE